MDFILTVQLFFKFLLAATAGTLYVVAAKNKEEERFLFIKCLVLSALGGAAYNFGPLFRDIYFKDFTFALTIPALSVFFVAFYFLVKVKNHRIKRNAALFGILGFVVAAVLLPGAQRLVSGDYYLLQNATDSFHQVFLVRKFEPKEKITAELAAIYEETGIPAHDITIENMEHVLITEAFIDNEWPMESDAEMTERLESYRYKITHYPADGEMYECRLDMPREHQTYIALFVPQGDGTYYMRYVVCGVLKTSADKTGGYQRAYLN